MRRSQKSWSRSWRHGDENGQLFVAEYLKFPSHRGKSDRPDGRIRRLRDEDGDGRYETATIFAGELAWPTGICPWDGGIFVVSAPDLWYFKDADGDGKAEIREKVFTGFGFRNDEGTANNLLWGLDNWIYGAGSNSGGDVRPGDQPEAAPVSIRGRDFRFHPVTRELQAISGSAQFGNAIDDFGNRFITSNSMPGAHVVLPARYLERNPFLPVKSVRAGIAPGTAVYRASKIEAWRVARTKLRLEAKPGSTGPSYEHDVFTGVAAPAVYRGGLTPDLSGQYFVGDVQSNIVHRRVLEPNGSTILAERIDVETEFLRSTDNWFRPANLVNGPDGALHIVDMHRHFIETPDSMTEEILAMVDFGEGRDMGRIYRLVPKGFQPSGPPQLGSASTAELVGLLESPHGWVRDTAARLLYQRQDKSAVEPIRALSGSDSAPTRMHALHALNGLGALKPSDVAPRLKDESPGVRRHAARLAEGHDELLDSLLALAEDPHPHVRFQAAFSLGESKAREAEVAAALVKLATDSASDAWLKTAVLSSPPRLAAPLFEAAIAQNPKSPMAPDLAKIVGTRNEPAEVRQILKHMENPALLTALGDGLRQARSGLGAYADESPELRQLLAGFVDRAKKTLSNSSAKVAQLEQAIDLLAHAPWGEASAPLSGLLTSQQSPAVQLAAMRCLGGFSNPETPAILIEAFPGMSPSVRGEVIEMLLSREAWAQQLLDAIGAKEIAPGYISVQRRAVLIAHQNAELAARSKQLLGTDSNPREKVVADYTETALNLKGNVGRGKLVFQQTCIACHKVGDLGHEVGPNLATIQNRTPDSLLVQILDPNREVLANFTQYFIELNDGSVVTGQIASESPASITLRRAEGIEESILRQNIRKVTGSGVSLMPEGLENVVSHQQMSDLIVFLLSSEN